MEKALIAAADETMQPEHVSLWLQAGFVAGRRPPISEEGSTNDFEQDPKSN
jgi:hypothetical protein